MQTSVVFRFDCQDEVDWWIRTTAQVMTSRIEGLQMVTVSLRELNPRKLMEVLHFLLPGTRCEKLKGYRVSIWVSLFHDMAKNLQENPVTNEFYQEYLSKYSTVPQPPKSTCSRIKELEAQNRRLCDELEIARKVLADKERRLQCLRRKLVAARACPKTEPRVGTKRPRPWATTPKESNMTFGQTPQKKVKMEVPVGVEVSLKTRLRELGKPRPLGRPPCPDA